jgi:YHS domain-containing protein
MKTRFFSALWIALFLVAGECSSCAKKDNVKTEQKAELKPQTHCPVMDGPVKKEVFADHNGKRIYFCCNPCVEEFKKNPEKYLEKLENEGVILEDAPKSSDTQI